MCRLGHSLIDLWLLYVNQVGRLDARARSGRSTTWLL